SSKESVPGLNTLDVTELVNGVLEHLKGRFEFEKNNISLRKKYKGAAINILGDPQKLKRALINIITNGCQAMQENGVLTVDIIPNSKEVDIKISDTGTGMTPHEMAKIFDPFYTTKAMGMGLGLAISKKIIEDHGGRIAVESKLSQGTTFTISLQVEKKSDN
ncbi:MAG: ATP-binding protein, partial [Nitrospirota bacterium]